MSCGDLFPVSGGERQAAAADVRAVLKPVRPNRRRVFNKQKAVIDSLQLSVIYMLTCKKMYDIL